MTRKRFPRHVCCLSRMAFSCSLKSKCPTFPVLCKRSCFHALDVCVTLFSGTPYWLILLCLVMPITLCSPSARISGRLHYSCHQRWGAWGLLTLRWTTFLKASGAFACDSIHILGIASQFISSTTQILRLSNQARFWRDYGSFRHRNLWLQQRGIGCW
jgi:hypothetical protein